MCSYMKKLISLSVAVAMISSSIFIPHVIGAASNYQMIGNFEPCNDFGDYTFFDSDMIYTGPDEAKYPNLEVQPKTEENTIELGRLDYTNQQRPDYIYACYKRNGYRF